jgi:predicted DNA-binding mobile mystery protein A
MSIKRTVIAQYQSVVDQAAIAAQKLRAPREGWIRTVRKAVGMSGAQLGRRMGVSRAQMAQTERNELSGSVTLKSMQRAAEALGCRFVYAIVPREGSVEALIEERARQKAKTIVAKAEEHMALEAQTLSPSKNQFEIDRLTQEFIRDLPSELWNDK